MGKTAFQDRAEADAFLWRAPAPAARAATMALYSWGNTPTTMVLALAATLPAILAALLAPALLTYAPTADLLAPIAEARAVASGSAQAATATSPFTLTLLLAGDVLFESPGRIHLGAKAVAALIAAASVAVFAGTRFAMLQVLILAAATAAFVAAPLSGPPETALALLMAIAVSFLCAPARETRARAALEGALAGLILVTLWMSSAILALFGVAALSACPFLSGGRGLTRYAGVVAIAALGAGLSEWLAPGVSAARALSVSSALGSIDGATSIVPAFDFVTLSLGAGGVLLLSMVFGGHEHRRNWGLAISFVLIGWTAAIIAGAEPAIVFAFAAAITVFSTTSPFYDGVFRAHDRASIAVSGAAGLMALGLCAAIVAQSTNQFVQQARAAALSPVEAADAFGIVQPPEQAIARWVEEGRFATAEARALFPLTPADQSAMLLAAAAQVRALRAAGFEAAILAQGDIACVIAGRRDCARDGRAAAARAAIVLVPRLDLDAASVLMRDKSEALLYTEFRKVEETPRWDIWVRRGVTLPDPLPLAL